MLLGLGEWTVGGHGPAVAYDDTLDRTGVRERRAGNQLSRGREVFRQRFIGAQAFGSFLARELRPKLPARRIAVDQDEVVHARLDCVRRSVTMSRPAPWFRHSSKG